MELICSEAAWNLKVYRRYYDIDYVIIPVLPNEDIEPENEEEEPKSFVEQLDPETKKAWIEKIQRMKMCGYSDNEIVRLLSPSAEKLKRQKRVPVQRKIKKQKRVPVQRLRRTQKKSKCIYFSECMTTKFNKRG